MLSSGCEVVSRRISFRSSTASHRSISRSHDKCRSAHRKSFSLVRRSPTQTLLPILLFWLIRPATVHSPHTFLPYAQLLCLESLFHNYKELPILSSANITVYSLSTWIEVTHRNNSSLSWILRLTKRNYPEYSSKKSERCAELIKVKDNTDEAVNKNTTATKRYVTLSV
jgi:hypothetical protein